MKNTFGASIFLTLSIPRPLVVQYDTFLGCPWTVSGTSASVQSCLPSSGRVSAVRLAYVVSGILNHFPILLSSLLILSERQKIGRWFWYSISESAIPPPAPRLAIGDDVWLSTKNVNFRKGNAHEIRFPRTE